MTEVKEGRGRGDSLTFFPDSSLPLNLAIASLALSGSDGSCVTRRRMPCPRSLAQVKIDF